MVESNRSVIDEIAAERRRQIEEEGWTPEHDDEHDAGELAYAAVCYAMPDPYRQKDAVAWVWPWGSPGFNPKDPRRNLIRAAALIVAEIERLDRKAESDA